VYARLHPTKGVPLGGANYFVYMEYTCVGIHQLLLCTGACPLALQLVASVDRLVFSLSK